MESDFVFTATTVPVVSAACAFVARIKAAAAAVRTNLRIGVVTFELGHRNQVSHPREVRLGLRRESSLVAQGVTLRIRIVGAKSRRGSGPHAVRCISPAEKGWSRLYAST